MSIIRNVTDVKTPRRTGRPPLTDSTALLAAAREIGFPALTVGAVTSRVGVKYSTFYRHFPSLESLLAALVEEVFDDAVLPVPGNPWQTYLRDAGGAVFDLFAAHPGLAGAVVRLPDAPTRLVDVYRQMTDLLMAAGFAAEDAALMANAVLEIVVMPWITTSEEGAGMVRRRRQAAATPIPVDPRIRAVVSEVPNPPRAWTLSKIDLLIGGLELRLPRS